MILLSTMEGFRTFLESSTIHGLTYISTTRRFSKVFWTFTVITGFTTAAFLIHTSFQSWADSPIKTTVEKLPISEIKFPKVTVCPPRDTFTDLNYDLMLAENITFEEEQGQVLRGFIFDVINDHVYMDEWTKLNEDNRYFNWYHGYTKMMPPENHPHLGNTYEINSHALSGVVTTQYFGEQFQKDVIEKKVYYPVVINPPENFLLDENITLHIQLEVVSIAGHAEESIFIFPGFKLLELKDAYFNVSPPVKHMIQFKREIELEDLTKVRMDVMPGFRLRWHYTSNNGTELDKETQNYPRTVPQENHELVKYSQKTKYFRLRRYDAV